MGLAEGDLRLIPLSGLVAISPDLIATTTPRRSRIEVWINGRWSSDEEASRQVRVTVNVKYRSFGCSTFTV